jgi:hypothetical protein
VNLVVQVYSVLHSLQNRPFRVVGCRQGKLVVKTDTQTLQQTIRDVTGKTQPLEEFVRRLKATQPLDRFSFAHLARCAAAIFRLDAALIVPSSVGPVLL